MKRMVTVEEIEAIINSAIADKQNKPTVVTTTIAEENWSSKANRITITGVTANSLVQVTPSTKADLDEWTSNGVFCVGPSTNSISFSCTTTPSDDITIKAVVW